MRLFTVGIVGLGLAVFGGLVKAAEFEVASRCTIAVDASGPVDCRGHRSGPWPGPTPGDLMQEPDLGIDLNL